MKYNKSSLCTRYYIYCNIYLNYYLYVRPLIAITGSGKAFNEDGSLINEHSEKNIIIVLQKLVKLGKQLKTNPE